MPTERRTLACTVCCILLSMPSCRDSNHTTRQQVGDTVVVQNRQPHNPDTLRLREVLRIGSTDGLEEYTFHRIMSFAIGPSGEIYIHDENQGIRQYNRKGHFVVRVAGNGQGPYEVQHPIALAVSSGGELAVYDPANLRITVFAPGGAVRHIQSPPGQPRRGSDALIWSGEELWVGVHPPYPASGGITHPRPIFVRVAGQEYVDTIYTPANASASCPELTTRGEWAGFWQDKREPYVPKVKWTMGSTMRLITGCPSTYEFEIRSPGEKVVRVQRDYEPAFAQDEELRFVQMATGTGQLPHQRPAYTAFVDPGDDRIWVFRSGPSYPEATTPEQAAATGVMRAWRLSKHGAFDVFDSRSGAWLAVVNMPREAQYSGFPITPGVVVRGDSLWAVTKDADDVEYLVQYQVLWR